MELKYGSGGKASPKRSDSRLIRGRSQKNHSRSNLLDAIAKAKVGGVVSQIEEDGVVRMKIVVRKQDLKQMLDVMGGSNLKTKDQTTSSVSSFSVEQRLNILRKKHVLRAKQSRRGSWSPVLQSIPEEL